MKMQRMSWTLMLLLGSLACHAGKNQKAPDNAALEQSVEQLRSAIGRWAVTTEFLKPDGSVAKSVIGAYEFSWVVPDRVVSGRSEIPELDQAAGLLFYIDEKDQEIEMVSVGKDGKLWVMSGPLGGEQRTSQEYQAADGSTAQLRFTRYNVGKDSFESKMEYTKDGGKSWLPGNHQKFRRIPPETPRR